jgi:hypothetical protein
MMALKSYRLKFKKKPGKKMRATKDLITGGITALIGTALVVETASALRRI